ncbi:MAG: TonB-dependent receptor [Bacteroidales bacterium]
MIRAITTTWMMFLLIAGLELAAQSFVTGRVLDAANKNGLQDANVQVPDLSAGTITGNSGRFKLPLPAGDFTILFSNVGYASVELDVSLEKNQILDIGEIFLQPDLIALDEVNIISSVAEERKAPIALTTISERQIRNQLGDQPFPEIMKMVPGVYPTRVGGGSGDAEVNVRGFEQENVALLLNGIPISSVENGLVYWNNWIGLSDATRSVQVQRGLGVSNVALNSVGGTINIVTKTTEAVKGGSIGFSMTSYGNEKLTLNLSTGLMNNGVAVNFLGSRTQGPGYVDATYVDAWAYFLSVSKEFNKRHQLVFTALGAPERHGQRNLKLSQQEIDLHGIKFNKDWGSYNGMLNNASENFYHKPYITLNHYWDISERLFLASSLYYSPGYGGGKWSEAYGSGEPTIFGYRNPGGQINWEAIYQNNATHNDTAVLADSTTVTGYSKNIQTDFLASHHWGGLLSRLEFKPSENLTYTAGIHLRYFQSKLQEKVRDLLGGDFFIDNYAWAVDGPAGRNEIKTVGDIIKVDNGAINPSSSVFGQVEWKKDNLNAFLSGTFTNTWYQRFDNYNYVSDTKSEILLKQGFDVKAGVNYNINENHHVFVNGGYFSRAPYFKYVFGSFTNVPSKHLANEKVKAVEAGYGFTTALTRIRANAYYTYWQDKSFLSNEYVQLADNTQTKALVTGLDALHTGIEIEAQHQLTETVKVGAILSVGDWKWKNDVSATLFNDDNTPVDTVNVYADGLYVGGAPQFQAGLHAGARILRTFNLDVNWVYYDKIYADFDPSGRTNFDDNAQPFKIPAYSLLDVHLNYPFGFFGKAANFSLSAYNLLDSEHIIRGEDGPGHDLESFRGFWGFGRTFHAAVKFYF